MNKETRTVTTLDNGTAQVTTRATPIKSTNDFRVHADAVAFKRKCDNLKPRVNEIEYRARTSG